MSDCIGTGCKAEGLLQQIADLKADLAAAQRDRDEWKAAAQAAYGHDLEAALFDLAAARADAERYRWLRDHATPPSLASIAWGGSIEACNYSNPDEAIDAAIAGEKK